MFLIAVTHIFILLLYKRCITETALQRFMMLRGWQRLIPNIWTYSNKRMRQKVASDDDDNDDDSYVDNDVSFRGNEF